LQRLVIQRPDRSHFQNCHHFFDEGGSWTSSLAAPANSTACTPPHAPQNAVNISGTWPDGSVVLLDPLRDRLLQSRANPNLMRLLDIDDALLKPYLRDQEEKERLL